MIQILTAPYGTRMIELWHNADPVLQTRVVTVLARLERLQPDRGT